ncbi:MAG: hypothetical protein JOY62_02900 [Acidobacteriaceae bacterium]|nr:hypothetical protein [Acidobacteriaceae bacterium]MBV9778899.1 hypothetical protein [Acidobacteriaceae bacterium]
MGAAETLGRHESPENRVQPWYLVIWLTGVDYFSTLGYQPGIALLAAGIISPIATAALVAVTLLCALPIYSQVANRSYVGQGSIAMLENLLPGWWGRLLVLVLLGFAATDFVITMTLSAADAATHATENPYLHPFLHNARLTVTLLLLALLAAVFLKGFKEAIRLATAVCVPYLLLNVVVMVKTIFVLISQPASWGHWSNALHAQGDWTHIAIASLILFPRLALGLSGFETGVSVMPLIEGDERDSVEDKPHGRIRNTRKLLVSAAVIMSVLLLISSFVSAWLVPPEAYKEGGQASGRVIAYMAHLYLGNVFGSIYDISTILILWFAGASAMAGLLHLVPRYLPRVGLAPQWVAYTRPLVLVLFAFDVIITLIFRANVDAQGGAYATGVLVLMSSAAVASAISLWKERAFGTGFYCWLVVLVFAYTTIVNIAERKDGIIIASFFILFILVVSAISRYMRSTELRVEGHRFCDQESERIWNKLRAEKVNLIPVDSLDPDVRKSHEQQMSHYYHLDGPLAFVQLVLLDNRSEFLSPIEITAKQEDGQYLIKASQAVAKANTIAYLSELIHPAGIFVRLTRLNPMRQSFRYLLLGEGETGLMVYSILQHYWEVTHMREERPCIFLMSD